MKRIIAAVLAAAMAILPLPLQTEAAAASLITKRFDFGGLGAADGYIGVCIWMPSMLSAPCSI